MKIALSTNEDKFQLPAPLKLTNYYHPYLIFNKHDNLFMFMPDKYFKTSSRLFELPLLKDTGYYWHQYLRMQHLIVTGRGVKHRHTFPAVCAFKNIPVNTVSAVYGNHWHLDIASVSFFFVLLLLITLNFTIKS